VDRSVSENPVFDHEGPWTEAAYLALQHDGRVEVVDGTLLVGPGAGPQRLEVIERVRAALAAALPAGLRVQGPVPLRLGPDCVLMPDLIVTAASAAEPSAVGDAGDDSAEGAGDEAGETDAEAAEKATEKPAEKAGDDEILDAGAALMVIEVVGYDHGAVDRSFKPQLYARSRIPYSLLIDHDDPFAVADMIIGGRYHEYARAGGDEKMLIEEPFRFELDLTEATAPGHSAATAEPPAHTLVQTPAEKS
jgi:hypothetical protein